MADAVRKGRIVYGTPTHCPHGHRRTPANTKIKTRRRNGRSQRYHLCRTCLGLKNDSRIGNFIFGS
jgi:hypothetical protein